MTHLLNLIRDLIARLPWRREAEAGHLGATLEDGIGQIPKARTMEQIAADGMSPLEEWRLRKEPSRKAIMDDAAADIHHVKATFLGGMDVAIERFLQRMERAAAGTWTRADLPPSLFASVDDATLTDYAGLAEMIDEAMAPVAAELAVTQS